jgi:hypothetical protein
VSASELRIPAPFSSSPGLVLVHGQVGRPDLDDPALGAQQRHRQLRHRPGCHEEL